MKRVFVSILVLCFVMTIMSGCERDMFNNYENIKSVEIYADSSPYFMKKKIVTDRTEIVCLLKSLKNIKIERNARSDDILKGGVGLLFKIKSFDDDEYSFVINESLLMYENKVYVISGSIFDHEFYGTVGGSSEETDDGNDEVKIDFYTKNFVPSKKENNYENRFFDIFEKKIRNIFSAV